MTRDSSAQSAPPSSIDGHPVLLIATTHWLSMLGLALMLTAIVTWLVFLAVDMSSAVETPYIGIALFAVIPIVLLAGLILMPIGVWLGRRRALRRIRTETFDRGKLVRRLVGFVAGVSVINLVIGSQTALHAVHHMESREFCSSCHVMTPQNLAAEFAPHASLGCVECHVGDGAKGWIDSKINGTRQLLEVIFDRVPKPIPSAIESGRLISSDETCEACHWSEKPMALNLRVIKRYDYDELSTELVTVLTMHVGGRTMGGIHGSHNGPGVEISFASTDPKRQEIAWVGYTNSETGEERSYFAEGVTPADIADLPLIKMQCIDCHNRVAHSFMALDEAVDLALSLGHISIGLPYIKNTAVDVLEAEYSSSEEAQRQIPSALADFYRSEYPQLLAERGDVIAEAGKALAQIYSRNVFPELAVTWGTYPDNLGHESFPGCYRCHGGTHSTAEGETISDDCTICHSATAVEDTNPSILKKLGLLRPIKSMEQK